MKRKLQIIILLLLVSIMSLNCSDDPLTGSKMSKEELGRIIFQNKNLSNPVGQACGTCHSAGIAFTDPAHSTVSPGAIDNLFGNRNAPTVSYALGSPELYFDNVDSTYVGGFFLDGRVNTLEQQAKQPFFNPFEMNLTDTNMFVQKVKSSSFYSSLVAIYGESNDNTTILNNVADALAAFERSSEVNPFTSKFDYYMKGQATFTSIEQQGFEIFKDTTKGKCANCHVLDDDPAVGKILFTDFTYDNIGVPKNPFNPFYKMPPEINPEGAAYIDYGLAKTTNSAENNGQFKVSTLRNIAITPPYFHNGVYGTLEEVVHFYNSRDIDPSIAPPEITGNVNDEELGDLGLSKSEEKALVAFLKTLTDGYK